MAEAEFNEVLSVDKDKLFSVITEYAKYPDFVEGCKKAEVEKLPNGSVRVLYQVSVMSQDVTYTLDHKASKDSGVIEWTLVDSNFFKKNTGKWLIKPVGTGKSDVTYSLEVEFKVPVPGFILNRLVKGSLPGMVRSFEKQAKSQA